MATPYRVDPRIRAYGKARIEITRRARDEDEWQAQWHASRYPFPFTFGSGIKQCIQYTVEDYAAEIGFYIDVLGFPVSAFSPTFAQFTDPAGDFFFGVAAATEENIPTPPESLRIQFMVKNLTRIIDELEKRGITFEHKPEAVGSFPAVAALRSPAGVILELWASEASQPSVQPAAQVPEHSTQEGFWAEDADEAVDDNVNPEAVSDLADIARRNPTPVDGEEDFDEEEDALDEPVYVDEEEESEALTPIVARPQQNEGRAKPAFPTTIIRRTEDLLKGHIPLPARKVKGNGLGNYPTLDESGSPEI